MVGCGSRFVRDPVRQAGLLDFANAPISRVANLGTSCRVRVPLSFHPAFLLSFRFPLSTLPGPSLSLFRPSVLALPPSVPFLPLAVRFYVVTYSSPCRSYLPGDPLRDFSSLRSLLVSLPGRGIDRPFHPRAPRVFPSASHLPLAPSRSRTPQTSGSSSSRPLRPRSTYDAAGRSPTRNAERARARSKALALTATRAHRTRRRREYHLPNAVDAH